MTDLHHIGRFAPGAIGEPGHRVFYLQVFAEGTEVAVKCEKQQVAALGEHLVRLLGELPAGDPGAGSALPAEALPPTQLAWILGSISLGVDRADERLVVILEEFVDPEESSAEPEQLRLFLTAEQVRAYAAQVDVLLASSRPLCRLCEQPMDPAGHACPRLN